MPSMTAKLHKPRPPNAFEQQPPPPVSSWARTIRTASSSRTSTLAQLVEDEYERRTSLNGQYQNPHLPVRPHLQHHQRSSSAPHTYPHPQQQPLRKLPPPPRPVFPPSPPLSPEVAQGETPNGKTEILKKQGRVEEEEEAQLRKALEVSMQEQRERVELVPRESDEELQKALAESRALEQRRSTYVAQEAEELEAALLASQQAQPPVLSSSATSTPPRDPIMYRPRSSSLPSFSPSDLSASSYPAEKARLFPQGRPVLPPGAGGAYDDEQREMEMLTLAIRISEEEEKERKRLDEEEERRVMEQIRKAEERVMESRGMPSVRTSTETAQAGSTDSSVTSASASTLGAATVSSTSNRAPSSSQTHGSPGKGNRRSWLRPPLASKMSSTDDSAPPAPSSTTRPTLEATASSLTAATVDSYRTAPEGLPFSNLQPIPLPIPARPSQPHPPHSRTAPPSKPNRLPPTPPDTPQASFAGGFSPSQPYQQFQQQHLGPSSTPFSPPSAPPSSLLPPNLVDRDRFRQENDGSPFEMPYLTPSNSLRSSSGLGSGSGSGGTSQAHGSSGRPRLSAGTFSPEEYERLASASGTDDGGVRRRTTSGSTMLSLPANSSSGSGPHSIEDVDERTEEGSVLAIRNPDSTSLRSSSATSGTASSSAYDGERDGDEEGALSWSVSSSQHEQPFFESNYAGRSMSAIDEMTEPASSVVGGATDGEGGARQGSFPSTVGTGAAVVEDGSPQEVLREEGAWMRSGYSRSPGPVSSPLREGGGAYFAPRPSQMRRGSSSSSNRNEQQQPLSFPSSPPLPSSSSSQEPTSTASTTSTTAPAPSAPSPPITAGGLLLPPLPSSSALHPPEHSSRPHSARSSTPSPPLAPEDGLRFGYPSACARQPGHTCPADGLVSSPSVPSTIELSAMPVIDEGVGLGLDSRQLRSAWAVEARSWVSLLQFLLWHGDSVLSASLSSLSASPSGRCAALASLEFRDDDEEERVVRLVVELVDPREGRGVATHREIKVTHPRALGEEGREEKGMKAGKGKGKARAVEEEGKAARLATFSLPDVLHLPTRLSSIAIQLFTLRHLASIARATQPSSSPPLPSSSHGGFESPTSSKEGYAALREMADEIKGLVRAAAERERREGAGFSSPSAGEGAGEATPRAVLGEIFLHGAGGVRGRPAAASPPAEEQAQRLVDRLRERLRRLKRSNHPASSSEENIPPGPAPSSASRPPPDLLASRRLSSTGNGANKLVKPPPPPRTQPVSRLERVLSIGQADVSPEQERGEEEGGFEVVVPPSREEMRRHAIERQEEDRVEGGRPRPRKSSTQSNLKYLPVL
ncbi:hypothetical protein JCM8547_002527 [Rhodosporidiobolus lusitaniae]